MKNSQVYALAERLSSLNLSEICFPIRIYFYLQKNIQIIKAAYEEIEQARLYIGERFGTFNGTGYDILPENIAIAQNELNDLFNLEQDLNIHLFKLSDFNGIELTPELLSTLMFMIEK